MLSIIILGLILGAGYCVMIATLYIIARLAGTKHKTFSKWYKAVKWEKF